MTDERVYSFVWFVATADNEVVLVTCTSTEGVCRTSSIGDSAVTGDVYTLGLNQLVATSTTARHFQPTLYRYINTQFNSCTWAGSVGHWVYPRVGSDTECYTEFSQLPVLLTFEVYIMLTSDIKILLSIISPCFLTSPYSHK